MVALLADLNPPDFYLWGYLKDNVYGNKPQIIPELKTAITSAIRAIPNEEFVRVIKNFARHIQKCLQVYGAHLEHIFVHLSNLYFLCYRLENICMFATSTQDHVVKFCVDCNKTFSVIQFLVIHVFLVHPVIGAKT